VSESQVVTQLADAFLRLCRPALRPEFRANVALVGRDALAPIVQAELSNGKSVAFTGLSGVGKTALAGRIANDWHGPVFWFTLRPGFNDQTESLLFALADFLRGQGLSTAWRQATASKNKIDLNEMTSVIRFDLERLLPRSPLLCIDEIDLLDLTAEAHAQIFHILENFCKVVPMLFVGQQLIMDVNAHHHISGLNAETVAALLAQLNADPALQAQADALQRVTRGLPVLVRLWASLYASGDSMDDVLTRATTIASVGLLVHRIWQRLDETERALLLRLAVMRERVPSRHWMTQAASLKTLIKRGLVEQDASETVALLPHLRVAIQQFMSEPVLHLCHLDAPEAMEALGDYLEAVHHYSQAKRYDMAVWLWSAHRETEFDRGRATAVLDVLSRIPTDALTDTRDRSALLLERAKLLRMLRNADEALAELDQLDTLAQGPTAADAKFMRGELLERQNRVDAAVVSLREAVEGLNWLRTLSVVHTHLLLGQIYDARLQDVSQARREVRIARMLAEADSGIIEGRSDAKQGLQHFETALAISDTIEGALVEKYLLYGNVGRFFVDGSELDKAIHYIGKALQCAKNIGSRYRIMAEQDALITAYNAASRYTQAQALISETIQTALDVGNKLWIASCYTHAADTSINLGLLVEAEQYVRLAIDQEEEFTLPFNWNQLGMIRAKQGRHEEAWAYFQDSIYLAKKNQNEQTLAMTLKELGSAHQQAGNHATAQQAYQQAIQIFNDLKMFTQASKVQAKLDALN
jgi:tetratricopeptide (TPR) repeat protein/nucleoside-triphosphatase THEP1